MSISGITFNKAVQGTATGLKQVAFAGQSAQSEKSDQATSKTAGTANRSKFEPVTMILGGLAACCALPLLIVGVLGALVYFGGKKLIGG